MDMHINHIITSGKNFIKITSVGMGAAKSNETRYIGMGAAKSNETR